MVNGWLRDVVCCGGLFVLAGVAEGQGYFRGDYNTNLCPVGSEQVLSESAHQEASGNPTATATAPRE
jgi:hypothetical protein